jgi:hypothetical protein
VLIERPPATTRPRGRLPLWLRIVGLCLVGAITVAVVLLATHWPFTKDAITRSLQAATSRPVRIGAFHRSYFPPGCLAEDVRVLHNSHPDAPPLITIEKLLVRGSFIGMFTSPKRLAEVKVVGMRVRIPPNTSHDDGRSGIALNSGDKPLAISKVVADGALLEFLPSEPGKKPYTLRVDGLVIKGIGAGVPMDYSAIVTNSEPPGLIRAQGKFGPWNPDNPGVTPVSGNFTYRDVNLGVFNGISGTLQAKGKFHGPLAHIETEGTTETENFHVEHSGSSVRLAVAFKAVVNGTNGDTYLEPADAHFLRTSLTARGGVEGKTGENGKTTSLSVSVPNGRIEDILRLFVPDKTAPLSGAVAVRGKFLWPPGPAKFVEKIRMDLDFGIDHGRFQSQATQDTINRISESAQGESKKEQDVDPHTALSDLRGHVAFRNGVATFTGVSFVVPGASATLRGAYSLLTHRIDLHGVLTTKGKLSDTTPSFFKSLVLKAITPFFKKKHDIKVVPFKITGTFENASVSLD